MAVQRLLMLMLGVPAALTFNSFAGPYIAYGKRFYQCIDGCEAGWPWRVRVSHFHPQRPREPQRVTGYVDFTNDTTGIDDSLWVKIVLDLRSNNQWKQNAFIFSLPAACSSLREHCPDAFRVLFAGASLKGPCRGPPANYSLDDQPVRWVFPHFPVMPYGEYRLRFTAGRLADGGPFACFCVDCVAIPKI